MTPMQSELNRDYSDSMANRLASKTVRFDSRTNGKDNQSQHLYPREIGSSSVSNLTMHFVEQILYHHLVKSYTRPSFSNFLNAFSFLLASFSPSPSRPSEL
jgi:hypothetical protein